MRSYLLMMNNIYLWFCVTFKFVLFHIQGLLGGKLQVESEVNRLKNDLKMWVMWETIFYKVDYIGDYTNGHSHKWTALLIATFTKPCFSQLHTNSGFLHSHKQPAQVANTPLVSQGCPLMIASTVFPIMGTSLKEEHTVLYEVHCWSRWSPNFLGRADFNP